MKTEDIVNHFLHLENTIEEQHHEIDRLRKLLRGYSLNALKYDAGPQEQVMPNFGDEPLNKKIETPEEQCFENTQTKRVNHQNVTTPILFQQPQRPTKGIAVDVGCKGNPGKVEFRGVDIESNKEVFHIKMHGTSTNNVGEWLACVHGLMHVMRRNEPGYNVYTDSITAKAWIRDQKCKSKHVSPNADQKKMILDAENFLKLNGGRVHFWDNKLFGEIPADLSGVKGIPKNLPHL